MSAFQSGDTLTPSTLNRLLSSAVSRGGYSSNTLMPESGSTTSMGGLQTGQVVAQAPGYPYFGLLSQASTVESYIGIFAPSNKDAALILSKGTSFQDQTQPLWGIKIRPSADSLFFETEVAGTPPMSLSSQGTLALTGGLQIGSEGSLFISRSAASTIALSYGTLSSNVSGATLFGGSVWASTLSVNASGVGLRADSSHVTLVTGNVPSVVIFSGGTGGGGGVIAIGNCSTTPTTAPASGGQLFARGGALLWRGGSNSLTTIAVP